jgi:pyruvate carboxylase
MAILTFLLIQASRLIKIFKKVVLMKTNVILLISSLLFFNLGYCQEEEANYELSKVFSTKENSQNILSKIANENLNKTKIINQNTILVRQIGNQNTIEALSNSSKSSIILNQNGANNSILIDKTADKISQFVSQNGNYNNVVDINTNYGGTINSNYIQIGNNLNITSIGANSISEKMEIKQASSVGGSVIILNK